MLIKEREGIMAGSACVPMDIIVSGSIKVILKKEFSNSDDPE